VTGGTGNPTGGADANNFVSDGQGGTSELAIFLGDEGLVYGAEFQLPAVVPSETANVRLRLQIANLGASDLGVKSMALLPLNADTTAANKYVTLLWPDDFDPDGEFPYALGPYSPANKGPVLEAEILWAPLGVDENSITLAVETDNPLIGTRTLVLKAPDFSPKARVSPDKGFFWDADLTGPETLEFEIHNDGLGLLEVSSVQFGGKQTGFELLELELVGNVKPKGAVGYKPLKFHVSYQPYFGSNLDTAKVLIATNDPGAESLQVELESKFETSADMSPCIWTLPGPDKKVLDYTDTLEGSKSLTLTMRNVGTSVCNVMSATVTNDPDGQHYVVQAKTKGDAEADPPEPDIPVDIYPVGVAPGKELAVDVTYIAGDAGFDSPFVIEYQDPLPRKLELTCKGGDNKPCLEYGPNNGDNPLPLTFVGEPSASASRKFLVRSCGTGALTISAITITDDVNPAEPSVYWAVGSPGAENVKIPAGSSQLFTLLMTLPNEEGTAVNATMDLVWSNGLEPQVTSVPLSALADSTAILPVADTGLPENYENLFTGEAFLLDGNESSTGVEEVAIADEGYLWFVVNRPADSTVTIKEEWGGATRFVIPDTAGTYSFGLLVKTDGALPLISPAELVDINVSAPPDPEPDP